MQVCFRNVSAGQRELQGAARSDGAEQLFNYQLKEIS
jgi:hypothetical protein